MRKANASDKNLVLDILVSAFAPITEDNSINFVIKKGGNRKKRMRVLMSYLFERALLFGDVFISDNESSCLLVSYSSREKTTLKTVFLELDLALNCIGIMRVGKILNRQSVIKKNNPKEDFLKPMILGNKEDGKHKGTAARLIIEAMNAHKDNTLPLIVNAADLKNVSMYKKFGFHVYNTDKSLGFPLYFLRLDMNKK